MGDGWEAWAQRLADDLSRSGKVTESRWWDAVRAVPRHVLVPDFHRQGDDGSWTHVSSATVAGLEAVYSNSVLVTALGADASVLSSSSQPGLMVRMLEELDLRDGHRVLEIGTGTGYNAALLSHRLGDTAVYSIDVEPELVALATERLATIGYHPTLAVGDGAGGLPEHAPFDRVIATCAVPAIPPAWIEQVRPGGVVLTDLKPALGAGNLVRLVRRADGTAEGRFDPTYAVFMDLRPRSGAGRRPAGIQRSRARSTSRVSILDPRTAWNSLVVWFLASFDLGPGTSHGYTGTRRTGVTGTWIATPDGSWAEIGIGGIDGGDGGGHRVVEGGPRRLWSIVEDADRSWRALDRPGWERFGLTVAGGTQTVWLDEPAGAHRWTLAIPPAYPG